MCPKLRGLKRGSSLLVLPDSLHFHTRVRNTLTSADFWKDCIELEIRLEKICNFYMNTWICVYGIALDSLKPSLISLDLRLTPSPPLSWTILNTLSPLCLFTVYPCLHCQRNRRLHFCLKLIIPQGIESDVLLSYLFIFLPFNYILNSEIVPQICL